MKLFEQAFMGPQGFESSMAFDSSVMEIAHVKRRFNMIGRYEDSSHCLKEMYLVL